jgi:hypothetical protein
MNVPWPANNNNAVLLGHYNAKYMGGHTEHPTPSLTGVFLYQDKIVLQSIALEIQYSSIIKIENASKEEIAGFLFIGPIGTWWKKNHRYTVIQYKNDIDTQTIVIDFEKNIDSAQPIIYKRMKRFKQASEENHPKEGFLVYENLTHGIRMRYPSHWIEFDTNEREKDFFSVIQFRTTIENKSPFVTLFINTLSNDDMSLREFVDKEMDELKNDFQDYIQEELTNTVVGDSPAFKLVYSDEKSIIKNSRDIFKELIIWTKNENKVYEIRYLAKQPDYLSYLPVVENMINSFQIIGQVDDKTIDKDTQNIKKTDDEVPLVILKRRFARGEITEEEYTRMRRLIEN